MQDLTKAFTKSHEIEPGFLDALLRNLPIFAVHLPTVLQEQAVVQDLCEDDAMNGSIEHFFQSLVCFVLPASAPCSKRDNAKTDFTKNNFFPTGKGGFILKGGCFDSNICFSPPGIVFFLDFVQN